MVNISMYSEHNWSVALQINLNNVLNIESCIGEEENNPKSYQNQVKRKHGTKATYFLITFSSPHK